MESEAVVEGYKQEVEEAVEGFGVEGDEAADEGDNKQSQLIQENLIKTWMTTGSKLEKVKILINYL